MDTTTTTIDDDMQSDLEKARLLYELGRYEELLSLLMPQLDSLDDPEAGYSLSVYALQGLERYEQALQLAEQGLSRHPDSAQLLVSYASVLGFCGRYEKALEQAEAVLATDPDHPAAHHHRSFCLFKLRRTKEAKTAAEATLALAPDTADTLVLLAWIEQRLGNTQRFRELLDRALQINPCHANALTLQATSAKGLWNQLRLLRTGLALDPGDPVKQQAYALLTRQLPRDLAIWLLLILSTGLAGFLRPHPAATWLLDAAFPLALASGLIQLRFSYYHIGGYLTTVTAVFCTVRYWDGTFGYGTIPLGIVLSIIAAVALLFFRIRLLENAENLRTFQQQLQMARRQGTLGNLLLEWLPPRVVLAMLAVAGLPALFLYGMYYNPPPLLLFVMTSAPVFYRLAGIKTFEKAFVACFKLAAWTFLPLIFFSIIGHQETEKRPLLLAVLYLFAFYRAWRQHTLAKQDD